MSFSDILSKLGRDEAIAILRYVLNEKNIKKPIDTLKSKIRYKRTKKALLFINRFFKEGINQWQLYTCKISFRKLRSLLKKEKLDCTNFTNLTNHMLKKNIDYVYYVLETNIKTGKIPQSEGIIFRLNQSRYLLANKNLAEKTENILEKTGNTTYISEYIIAPYKFNILVNSLKIRIVSAVFLLNPQITGEKGVDEIEVRGPDVIRGLQRIRFRLDRTSKTFSIFGPLVKIRLENGLVANSHGTFSAKNLADIIDFITYLENLEKK